MFSTPAWSAAGGVHLSALVQHAPGTYTAKRRSRRRRRRALRHAAGARAGPRAAPSTRTIGAPRPTPFRGRRRDSHHPPLVEGLGSAEAYAANPAHVIRPKHSSSRIARRRGWDLERAARSQRGRISRHERQCALCVGPKLDYRAVGGRRSLQVQTGRRSDGHDARQQEQRARPRAGRHPRRVGHPRGREMASSFESARARTNLLTWYFLST